ncbi:Premnaspirodiene oxygenase [Apostasia shenzhenica]|uniref:Premnaspirodiene oxygenase n=1 Tax=Apostasia shenzhenica TaxID=1088818 RepID=A0A2I0AJF6_9ASPA|nr:Premnaspirodiene oxygenase [Apostasia shenzhenica]
METSSSLFLPIIIAFFLFLVKALLSKNLTRTRKPSSDDLPPGPWKLPFIGSLHHLVGGNSHRRFRQLAETHGPILHLKLGEVDLVVVSSPELAREVAKTRDLCFAARPQLTAGNILFNGHHGIATAPHGHYWSEIRKLCATELLSAKRVKSFAPIREEEAQNLIMAILRKTGSPVNLSEMLPYYTNAATVRAAFGREMEEKERFLAMMKEMMRVCSGFALVDLFPSLSFLGAATGLRRRMKKVWKEMDEVLEKVLGEEGDRRREAAGEEDIDEGVENSLVRILKRVKENGEFVKATLTRDNIKAIIVDMFAGGTDTTTITIIWALTEVLRHPKIMHKVQEEISKVLKGNDIIKDHDIQKMPYLKNVVKETLRMHPPGPLLLPRVCRETTRISKYVIPVGTRVIINAWALATDPKSWDDPESFRPERFEESEVDFKGTDFEYIPFGAGRRMCPGMLFGLAGIELWLGHLLYYFDWKIADGRNPVELDVEEEFGLTLNRKKDLCLIAVPRATLLESPLMQ